MEVLADRVAVTGAHGALHTATSLVVRAGEVAVVAGHPGPGLTAFGLALTGRLVPSAGAVTPPAPDLRAASALVDSPGVSAPEDNLSAADVVAEELTLAGASARRPEITRVLDEYGVDGRLRFEDVPAASRVALLTGLAARRPGVRLLVLDNPDRHGDEPAFWWDTALAHARDGLAVVALVAAVTAPLLPVTPARLGELDQPAPTEATR